MGNLFDILFSEVNLILTVLLIVLLLYWVVSMISGIDFDVDFDVEVDLDPAIDAGTAMDGGNMDFQDLSNAEVNQEDVVGKRRRPLKWWQVFLIYFNFVGLPFMFTFTCWIFIWWFMTALTTAVTFSYDNYFGFAIMLIAMFPALIVNKIFTTPFKGFFKNLNKNGDTPIDYLGRKGLLLSSISGDRMGNAEVKVDGNTMSVYVKSISGDPLPYGSKILIIKRSADQNYYLVESYNE